MKIGPLQGGFHRYLAVGDLRPLSCGIRAIVITVGFVITYLSIYSCTIYYCFYTSHIFVSPYPKSKATQKIPITISRYCYVVFCVHRVASHHRLYKLSCFVRYLCQCYKKKKKRKRLVSKKRRSEKKLKDLCCSVLLKISVYIFELVVILLAATSCL